MVNGNFLFCYLCFLFEAFFSCCQKFLFYISFMFFYFFRNPEASLLFWMRLGMYAFEETNMLPIIYIYIICFKKVKFTKSQNHSTLVIRYFRNYCSMFPRSTHETFATKLYQTFKDHKRFSKPKLARTDFTICHYAGDVCIFCLLCN